MIDRKCGHLIDLVQVRDRMQTGAIILCGGKSSRMGRDKATLRFGSELMLHRMIRILSEVVERRRIVIVAAHEQQLPALPAEIIVTHDRLPDRGPLEGLAAGLDSLGGDVNAAYATSCDAPLLVPAFVRRMFELLNGHDIAVPHEDGRFHPLAAVYRPCLLKHARQLLQTNRRRLQFLLDEANTRIVEIAELRTVDPELKSLVNLNNPDEYQAALAVAGFLDRSVGFS